ncbi:hypothetical protein EGY07_21710 [Chryseobacterium indologenes]|uniref:tetratricopeptide repeat protein n=1 Tax=Chryseobacterium indologenes TaxID=253 RepID=UPI000F4FFDCA|nr:tetratricopeptide repeat protein [Chryseobacterium indologenes]AYZ37963.1 hypothetical protein EGY07_21710 [Chryseobacterium indologenes]MBF6646883.1 tetratricopeptide repeat protein [Chryseobacterium indologenes]MBU3049288.1 tetratricopeptide repeat protein [Chryseobacterium indologenes]MEB4761289.1 tetratricopeptide repeat protein [Chryseobacterium indologenes]QQQ69465.1 tetratricopeptide repeat protein [Chryseobacterium indologenes]
MEKSLKFCLSFLGLLIYSTSLAQVNCNTFTTDQCRESCEKSNFAEKIQWTQYAQELFDEAIKLCPTNDFAFKEKAVPYLKSGDFVTWKKLIDKAVELDPQKNLGYRGWCKFQFLRDYSGAIRDLEALKKYYPEDLGRSQNGDYNLGIVKAMSYSALGQKEKAAGIIERLLARKAYVKGMYDHYQLGVTYFELGRYDKALENFEEQSREYDFAENIYFKSKVSKIRNKDYLDLKTLALQTYDAGKTMKDGYTHHFNKIYRKQIEEL